MSGERIDSSNIFHLHKLLACTKTECWCPGGGGPKTCEARGIVPAIQTDPKTKDDKE